MNTIEPDTIPYNVFVEEYGDEALYDPHYNLQDDLLPYDLTNEGNEDAWLDAAYEDRFADGYEPEWEY
jgi:hypothetical protein